MRRKAGERWLYQRRAAAERERDNYARRLLPPTECECGAPLVAGRCASCERLDGAGLSRTAKVILSELRLLSVATWETLEMETGYCQRQLHRGMRELIKDGYISRREVESTVLARGGAVVAEFAYIGTKAA